MVIEKVGDALKNDCDVFCHQVNLEGILGGGIAWHVSKKCDSVDYLLRRYDKKRLGEVCFVRPCNQTYAVANCFSQSASYDTDYEALRKCLDKVVAFMRQNGMSSAAIPWHYGCGIANGDWNIVKAIFEEKFKDFTLKIYKLR